MNNKESRFEKIDGWFNYMADSLKKLEELTNESKINSVLIDNDIQPI